LIGTMLLATDGEHREVAKPKALGLQSLRVHTLYVYVWARGLPKRAIDAIMRLAALRATGGLGWHHSRARGLWPRGIRALWVCTARG